MPTVGGTSAGAPRTATLSKVAVLVTALLWLVTASPTYAVLPSAIVSLPTSVHVLPSADTYPVTVLPLRTSRTQYGTVAAGPAVCVVCPPATVRRWNAVPFPGV